MPHKVNMQQRRCSFYLAEEHKEFLYLWCIRNGLGISTLIRSLAIDFVKKHNRKGNCDRNDGYDFYSFYLPDKEMRKFQNYCDDCHYTDPSEVMQQIVQDFLDNTEDLDVVRNTDYERGSAIRTAANSTRKQHASNGIDYKLERQQGD